MGETRDPRAVILAFLRQHTLAVIATTHPNSTPEAAVIDFSVRDDLEIVFDTFSDTRKYANLIQNSAVALVVGWDNNITVQLEGLAEPVPAADVDRYQRDHVEHVPEEREFIEKGAVIFRVRPRWIRYSNFAGGESSTVVLTF